MCANIKKSKINKGYRSVLYTNIPPISAIMNPAMALAYSMLLLIDRIITLKPDIIVADIEYLSANGIFGISIMKLKSSNVKVLTTAIPYKIDNQIDPKVTEDPVRVGIPMLTKLL